MALPVRLSSSHALIVLSKASGTLNRKPCHGLELRGGVGQSHVAVLGQGASRRGKDYFKYITLNFFLLLLLLLLLSL